MKRKYRLQKSQLRRAMIDAARAAKRGGREICGFLVDNGYFLKMVRLRNKTRKGGSFSFYARDVRQLEEASELLGHEIVGAFHSHPVSDAVPGESDIARTGNDSLMLIIDVIGNEAALWHIKNKKKRRLQIELL